MHQGNQACHQARAWYTKIWIFMEFRKWGDGERTWIAS